MQIYNLNKIFFLSLIFTPLFGSILLYFNAKEIKMNFLLNSSKTWLFYNFIAFILNLIIPFFMIIFFLLWWKYSFKEQDIYIKNNLLNYQEKSFIKPLSISFSILFVLVFSIAIILMNMINTNNGNMFQNITEHFQTLKTFETK